MVSRELVDEAWDGTKEFAHFDTDGNLVGLEWKTDVESVIDANKRAQNDGTRGYGKTREWKHVASIPPAILMEYAMKRFGASAQALAFVNTREGFDDVVKKMINDPDYRWLRTDA
jgi:hypothetical protein